MKEVAETVIKSAKTVIKETGVKDAVKDAAKKVIHETGLKNAAKDTIKTLESKLECLEKNIIENKELLKLKMEYNPAHEVPISERRPNQGG